MENYSKILPTHLELIFLCFTGKTLEEQGITHNVKVMVLELKLSEEETRKKVKEEELQHEEETVKKKEMNKRMQRTKKGLEILAERGQELCAKNRTIV